MNLSNLGILVSALPLKHDRWPIFQAKSHPLQAAVRKPQKVLEGAQEMAGSNLGEKNELTRQLLMEECFLFFGLSLHIFTTCVLCYLVTSLFSLGK